MRTTAFLTLTGSGTVIREWLTQISTGAPAPELLLLAAALVGLGVQTLHSEWVRTRTHPAPQRPARPAHTDAERLADVPSGALSGA